MIKKFKDFLLEISGEILDPKRGEWLQIEPNNFDELKGEFYDLISTAYHEIGGHVKIKSQEDVFKDKDWNYWSGVDIHNSKDLDIIIFGQKTNFGIKYSGVGHDGSKEAKMEYIKSRGQSLHKIGHYVEVSGKIADILIKKYNVPVVKDPEEIEKVLGKKVEFIGKSEKTDAGEGWYVRSLGGHDYEKILLGRPKV